MHIVLNDDIALQVETDGGRLRMQIDIDSDAEIRFLISTRRNYRNLAKGGIKSISLANATTYTNITIYNVSYVQKSTKTLGP